MFPAASVAVQVSSAVPQKRYSRIVSMLLNSLPASMVPSSLVSEHVGSEPSNTLSVTVGRDVYTLGPSLELESITSVYPVSTFPEY